MCHVPHTSILQSIPQLGFSTTSGFAGATSCAANEGRIDVE